MSTQELIDETKEVAETSSTDVAESRAQQIHTLAQSFIKNRLENTSGIEKAKAKAIEKMITALDDVSSPRHLMTIIQQLSEITSFDLDAIIKQQTAATQGPRGPGGLGGVNIFMGGNPAPAEGDGSGAGVQDGTANIPKSVFTLVDILMEISETVDFNKEDEE